MVDEAIGMMDKAYFVGKAVIIQWVNELLSVSVLTNWQQTLNNPFHYIAESPKNWRVCDWGCLLRDYGLFVPEYFSFCKSEVGRQTWARIRWKLQDPPKRIR